MYQDPFKEYIKQSEPKQQFILRSLLEICFWEKQMN